MPFLGRLFKIIFVYLYVENNNTVLQVFVNCEFIIIHSSKLNENNSGENDESETLSIPTCRKYEVHSEFKL